MHWIFLAIGICIEVLASASLMMSDGFTKFGYAALKLIFFGVAFYFMSLVMSTLPVGIAYSVWAGGGIAGVTLMGTLVFGQSLDGYAYLGIGLILAGVIVLNALSTAATG